MDRIVIDDRLPERLAIRIKPAELVTRDGRVLGVFTPTHTPPDGTDGADFREPTLEQLEETKRKTTRWYTTEEVLAHLRSLG